MNTSPALAVLDQEAIALQVRLNHIKPFALNDTSVSAAALSWSARSSIETYLAMSRKHLRDRILDFRRKLKTVRPSNKSVEKIQRQFTILRLSFNAILAQFDIFSDAITQRSESDTGIWLAGLDAVATDALALREYYDSPSVICYLDRGAGAAIRRARTRLPGGGDNPVAVIRIPRERMIGSGIASSLVHEVGHQAAALLDLVNSLRTELRTLSHQSVDKKHDIWKYWERWISEIVADFWSISKIGIGSTIGLMGVVSLPRAFVFRVNMDDPHPIPWIRVMLSAAIGNAIYPHPQWIRYAKIWESFYPKSSLDPDRAKLFTWIQAGIPDFIEVLLNHRSKALRNKRLLNVIDTDSRKPVRLKALFRSWQIYPKPMYKASPTLVFAAIGQARADGIISPQSESILLEKLLKHWALGNALAISAACPSPLKQSRLAVAT